MFKRDVISVGDWYLVVLLMLVPILNIVLLVRLLSDNETNASLKNALVAFAIPVLLVLYIYVGTGLLFG